MLSFDKHIYEFRAWIAVLCIPRGWPCWSLLLVRERSLLLNRGMIHAVETEGIGEAAF